MPNAACRIILGLHFALLATALEADPLSADDIRDLTRRNAPAAIQLYREFLSLPNDANRPDDILALIDWMEPEFRTRGFETRRLPTAGSPLLFARRAGPAGAPTVLVYLQADGQPVDPSAWFQENPYLAGSPRRRSAGSTQAWSALQASSATPLFVPISTPRPARWRAPA